MDIKDTEKFVVWRSKMCLLIYTYLLTYSMDQGPS